MFSRSVAILIGTWLPMLALVVPMSPVHKANAIIAGIVATLFSLAALADNRARIGAAVVGAWVAVSPFIFEATLTEKVLTVSWGAFVFVHMIGPFADPPRVELVAAPDTRVPPVADQPEVSRAA